MRSRYRDEDAACANLQAPQPMDDADVANLVVGERRLRQLFHLLQCHLFVSFVIEIEGLSVAAMVAHDAVEYAHRAIFRALDLVHHALLINSFARDNAPPSGANLHRDASLTST